MPHPHNLDAATRSKVAEAGELLIRAAAVLGTLSADQQEALQRATNGGLPDSLAFCLRAARAVSPAIEESLTTHPPRGLVGVEF